MPDKEEETKQARVKAVIDVLDRALDRSPVRVMIWLSFAILVSFSGWRVANHLQTPQDNTDEYKWGLMDYQNTIYYPVVAFIDGVNPYDFKEYRSKYPVDADFPVYSPMTLLLHLPFGLLSFRLSNFIYFLFNVSLMVLLARQVLRILEIDDRWISSILLASIMILSRPGWVVILCGQIICEVTIGTIIALNYSKTKPFLSGVGIALASLKPTFGVPLAILMIFRRDWYAVFYGALLSVAGAGVAMILLAGSPGGVWPLIVDLWSQHVNPENLRAVPSPDYWMRVDLLSFLARVFGWSPGTASMVVVFAVVVGLTGLALVVIEKSKNGKFDLEISSSIISIAIVICIYHMEYDCLILSFPLLSFLKILGQKYEFLWFPVVGLFFVLFNPFMTKTIQKNFSFGDSAMRTFGAVDAFVITLVLLFCVVAMIKSSFRTREYA